ncbi:DNA repair protein XRCC3-like [Ornithodoros turicata]|uniref:DNA repair protein XRCC3-like n=1 Tax=Ornithodoros turicata TaxID=34597 RepID=UPI003138C7A9
MQPNPKYDLKNCEAVRQYYDTLLRHQLTNATSVIALTNAGLRILTGLAEDEADTVLLSSAKALLGDSDVFQSISALPKCYSVISLGCDIIDRFLGGGIPVHGITEISGESSSGKTQICLQLSIMALLTAASTSHAVYICTEDRFPDKRLRQMLQERGETGTDLSDNVLVSHVGELDALMKCLEHTLPSLRRTKNIRLVVIDSVAALFRAEYGEGQGAQRAADLMKFACVLDRVWRTGVVVVCVNQVSDVVSEAAIAPVAGAATIPSLGLSWANAVTTRIFVSRTVLLHTASTNSSNPPVVRRMHVAFAPHLPKRSEGCFYIVNARGVCGVEHVESAAPERK